MATTQDGIAAATLSGRPTVTKWVARLGARGWLVRERTRIPGYPLPKHVYRLSETGWREAERIRSQLQTDVVEVRSPSLGTLAARVADLPSLVSPPLALTTAISLVREGRIDLHRLPPLAGQAEGSIIWGESLRQVDRLFGRQTELRFLDEWCASESKLILVTGLPGIGKTALVASWIHRLQPVAHVFWHEVERSSKAAGVLAELGAFLARLGRPSLSATMSQDTPPKSDSIGRLLRKELGEVRVLLVLDGLEHADGEVQQLLSDTLVPAVNDGPSKLVIVSRRTPSRFGAIAPESLRPRILSVSGLSGEAAATLLRHRGHTGGEQSLRGSVAACRGHPLLLSLAADGGRIKASEVAEYLEDEVWDALPITQQFALETCCVFRRAVPGRLLEAAGARPGAIRALETKNLIERTVAARWAVHDLVREFVLGRTTEPRLRELHERAARPMLKELDPRDRWEGIYHLLAAGLERQAAEYLDSAGAPLVDSVEAAEVGSLVREHWPKSPDPMIAAVFSEIAGDSLRILGHWGPSIQQYEYAIRMANASGKSERIPRLLREIAFIERCRNRYPHALGRLVEAQARIAGLKNPAEAIELKRETALVEQALGDLSQASYHLNEAVDLATEISDNSALSRALLALSSLETLRGERQRGLEYGLEALRIAERSGNLTEVSRANIVVGTALAELGRLEESLSYYDRGLELARALGNLRLAAYGLLDRIGANIDLGRYDEAGSRLAEARGYFQILEEKDSLAHLRIFEGNLERGLGRSIRAIKAWEEGIQGLRQGGGPVDLVRVLREVGGYLVDYGKTVKGQAHLVEARELARRLGNTTLETEIEGMLQSRSSQSSPSPAI